MLRTRKNNASGAKGRVTFAAVAAAIVALAVTSATGLATQKGSQDRDEGRENEREPYAIGLWGDLPYSDLQATVGVPNLIADMNRQHLAFSVHDGDLKTGNGAPTCNDAMYVRGLGYLNSLEAPAMFTPGDNDWTDCDRPNNGRFNSLERLTHERQLFFIRRSRSGIIVCARTCNRSRCASASRIRCPSRRY